MRSLFLLVLLAAGVAALFVARRAGEPSYVAPTPVAAASGLRAPRHLASRPGPGEVERTLEVEGMCCRGCCDKLYATLMKIETVRDAAVDFETGTAQVVVGEQVPPEELASALCFDKYTARPRP